MAALGQVLAVRDGAFPRGVARPWIVGWLLGAAILIAVFGADALEQTFHEPDSAMRLVQVRDLLAGQPWFDTTQQRLDPPNGVPMHWARWIDAAIAAPIALFAPLLGRTSAEVLVAFIWPLAWLGLFQFFMVRIAGAVASAPESRLRVEWCAAIVAALAFPALDRFAPGMFDHHNVVLVLVSASVWAMISMRRDNRRGYVAGCALALSAATAAEALPFLGLGALALGSLWIAQPEKYARGLFQFGAAVILSMIVSFLALVPASSWSQQQCDAMSTNFLWIGSATGLTAIALSRFSNLPMASTVRGRAALAVLVAGCAALALYVLAPGCRGGGYGDVSPELRILWMDQIGEARPLTQVWGDNLAQFFGIAGAAIAGLGFALLRMRGPPRNEACWIAAAFLLGSVMFMAWQVRGAAFATTFAIPFAAVAVANAQSAYRKSQGIGSLGRFAIIAMTCTAAGWAVIGKQVQSALASPTVLTEFKQQSGDARACHQHSVLSQLNRAPPGLILNQFGMGSGVLAASGHSVLAAPYHRNAEGTLSAIEAFRSSPSTARELVRTTGADYILVCDGLPEADFYMAHAAVGTPAENTLAASLKSSQPPDWLERVDGIDAPLALYRVRSAPMLRGRY